MHVNKETGKIGSKDKKYSTQFSPLLIITAIMVTAYITSNVLAVKLITIFNLTFFDAGIIIFPITYVIGNILTEIWGFNIAKKVILLTFACNILFVLLTVIATFMPYPEYIEHTATSFKNIFIIVPRILFASLVAFLVGEITNSWFMEKIKKITKSKKLWLRSILSSAIGYLLDTVLFVLIAFSGVSPIKDLATMIFAQYAIKMILEILAGTPIIYGVISLFKKKGIN